MSDFRRLLPRSPAVALTTSLAAIAAVVLMVPADAAFPGVNGKIAFYNSAGEIFVMNVDGSGQTNLTNNSAGDVYPAWSADGTKIAFMSDRDGNPEIYVMDADGTDQTNLTNNAVPDDQPAWSPNGEKIVFTRSPGPSLNEIWVMNADGTGETQLTSGPAADADPAWSPDGTKIAFHRFPPRDIYVMNADGTGQTNLTNNGAFNRNPAWSPDGTKITFNAGPAGSSDIYLMNADGTSQTALTNNGVNGNPAWSPDGTKVVFDTFSGEIKMMNANGTSQTTLTSAGGAPDWQPLVYNFDGFFSPVDNPPTLNSVSAGRAMPVKFSLGGDRGLNIFAAGYPKVEQITCSSSAPVDGVEETVSAGGSGLSYDSTSDHYTYVWKTLKAWAATCRQLVMKFADLTFRRANFQFR